MLLKRFAKSLDGESGYGSTNTLGNTIKSSENGSTISLTSSGVNSDFGSNLTLSSRTGNVNFGTLRINNSQGHEDSIRLKEKLALNVCQKKIEEYHIQSCLAPISEEIYPDEIVIQSRKKNIFEDKYENILGSSLEIPRLGEPPPPKLTTQLKSKEEIELGIKKWTLELKNKTSRPTTLEKDIAKGIENALKKYRIVENAEEKRNQAAAIENHQENIIEAEDYAPEYKNRPLEKLEKEEKVRRKKKCHVDTQIIHCHLCKYKCRRAEDISKHLLSIHSNEQNKNKNITFECYDGINIMIKIAEKNQVQNISEQQKKAKVTSNPIERKQELFGMKSLERLLEACRIKNNRTNETRHPVATKIQTKISGSKKEIQKTLDSHQVFGMQNEDAELKKYSDGNGEDKETEVHQKIESKKKSILQVVHKLFGGSSKKRNVTSPSFPLPYPFLRYSNKGVNACFANAATVLLLSNPLFRSRVEKINDSKSDIFAELKNLMLNTANKVQCTLKLRRKVSPEFIQKDAENSYIQHDAAEFLDKIIEDLPENVNGLFETIVMEKTKCEKGCEERTRMIKHSPSVRVPIDSSGNLETMLRNSLVIGEEIDFECPNSNCNGQKTTVTSNEFVKLPDILMIQIKRFSSTGVKIETKIEIPSRIQPVAGGQFYKLSSSIVHCGDVINMGHYTTLVNENGTLWNCDDSDVTPDGKNLNQSYIVCYTVEKETNNNVGDKETDEADTFPVQNLEFMSLNNKSGYADVATASLLTNPIIRKFIADSSSENNFLLKLKDLLKKPELVNTHFLRVLFKKQEKEWLFKHWKSDAANFLSVIFNDIQKDHPSEMNKLLSTLVEKKTICKNGHIQEYRIVNMFPYWTLSVLGNYSIEECIDGKIKNCEFEMTENCSNSDCTETIAIKKDKILSLPKVLIFKLYRYFLSIGADHIHHDTDVPLKIKPMEGGQIYKLQSVILCGANPAGLSYESIIYDPQMKSYFKFDGTKIESQVELQKRNKLKCYIVVYNVTDSTDDSNGISEDFTVSNIIKKTKKKLTWSKKIESIRLISPRKNKPEYTGGEMTASVVESYLMDVDNLSETSGNNNNVQLYGEIGDDLQFEEDESNNEITNNSLDISFEPETIDRMNASLEEAEFSNSVPCKEFSSETTSKLKLIETAFAELDVNEENTLDLNCGSCGKNFSKKSNLKRHMQICKGEALFECKKCGKKFKTKKTKWNHAKKCSSQDTYSEQGVNDEVIFAREDLQCQFCKHILSSSWNLQRHRKTCNETSKQFSCQKCRKSFPSYITFKNHKNKRCVLSSWKCKDCNEIFNEKIVLYQHRCKGRKCAICGQMFKLSAYLKRHIRKAHQNEHSAIFDISQGLGAKGRSEVDQAEHQTSLNRCIVGKEIADESENDLNEKEPTPNFVIDKNQSVKRYQYKTMDNSEEDENFGDTEQIEYTDETSNLLIATLMGVDKVFAMRQVTRSLSLSYVAEKYRRTERSNLKIDILRMLLTLCPELYKMKTAQTDLTLHLVGDLKPSERARRKKDLTKAIEKVEAKRRLSDGSAFIDVKRIHTSKTKSARSAREIILENVFQPPSESESDEEKIEELDSKMEKLKSKILKRQKKKKKRDEAVAKQRPIWNAQRIEKVLRIITNLIKDSQKSYVTKDSAISHLKLNGFDSSKIEEDIEELLKKNKLVLYKHCILLKK